MPRLSSSELAVLTGVVLQQFLFRIHEVPTVKFIGVYLAINVLLAAHVVFTQQPLIQIPIAISLLAVSLVVLTIIRRLFFHPLRNFPGPKLAAVSKLYEYTHVLGGKNFENVIELHRKYGDFVRIGPNELSINNVEAIHSVLGKRQGPIRGPFYHFRYLNRGMDNLISVRDDKVHATWRRIWEKAFTSRSVAKYSALAEIHVRKLISVLSDLDGKEAEATELTSNMTFDIMADTSFGAGCERQDGKGDPGYMPSMRKYATVLSAWGSLRNLCELAPYIPEPRDVTAFHEKGMAMVLERQKLGMTRDDVWTQLLQVEDPETGAKFSEMELLASAQLVIVAGTDTTSVILASCFQLLAVHSEAQKKLLRELNTIANLDTDSTLPLPYLNGVINEALRLTTPVPQGTQMTLPPQGVTVAGRYIPGLVDVRVPHGPMLIDDRYFVRGTEFIPERWTDEKPELLKDRRAFIPFAAGAHACLGKSLAMNELRISLANVVKNFQIELGESYDEKRYLDGIKDNFTLELGPLPVKFVARARG